MPEPAIARRLFGLGRSLGFAASRRRMAARSAVVTRFPTSTPARPVSERASARPRLRGNKNPGQSKLPGLVAHLAALDYLAARAEQWPRPAACAGTAFADTHSCVAWIAGCCPSFCTLHDLVRLAARIDHLN